MMRQFLMALAAVAVTHGVGFAQAAMPGQTVGTTAARPILKPVGTRLPAAAPQVGTPITGLATQQPGLVGPGAPGAGQQPQGTPIDLKNVVAPYPNMPVESTYWQKLEQRWFALFESDAPAVRPAYTPGIGRRNRDRREAAAEQMRRRD